MLILAHRGASRDAPENTLAAFREAVAQGADGVELDVMVCGSGELVVCHDPTLDRLANESLEIARTPYWLLRRADVGTTLGFSPERVPLLEEVLDLLPEHFIINIELKCHLLDDRGLSHQVGALLMRRGLGARVIVSSFSAIALIRLAQAYPSVQRGYLLEPDRLFAARELLIAPLASSYSIHPPHERCTPERVRRWHAAGLKVAAWTVDGEDDARRLQACGVDLCITNRPGELRHALER